MSKFSLLLSKIVTTALGQTEFLIYISKTKNSHLPNGQEGHRNSKLTDILVRCTVAQPQSYQRVDAVSLGGAWSCDVSL